MKTKSVLIMMLIAAHLLVSCDESPTSSTSTSSSSSSSSSASDLVGTWKDESGTKIQFAEGGSLTTVRPIDGLKHEGTWALLSNGRLKLDLTGPSGIAVPIGTLALRWDGKNSLTVSPENGKDEHWTRQ